MSFRTLYVEVYPFMLKTAKVYFDEFPYIIC